MRFLGRLLLALPLAACGGTTATPPPPSSTAQPAPCAGTSLALESSVTVATQTIAATPILLGATTSGGVVAVWQDQSSGLHATLIRPGSTPEIVSSVDVGTLPEGARVQAVAAAPEADAWMLVWGLGGPSLSGNPLHSLTVATLHVSGWTMASSPARDPGVGDVLSLDAGDDGNGFALLTESTTSTGNDTFSSFSLQGAPLVQIETSPGLLGAVASPRGYVSGVVGTPRGLAVIAADGSSSFTTTLLDSSGASVAQAKLVSGGFPRLAWTGSSLVAWWAPSTYTQESCPGTGVVTDLGLFGEPGWTASLALCNASAPFEAGGRVLVAGVTASGGLALLARTGSDFTQVSPVTTLQIAADGCGRPVELENTSGDPVSPWDTGGPLLAQAVPGTKPLPVSTSSPQVYVTGPSVAPVPVGLGVLWAEQEVGPGGPANLRFATLAWR